MDHQNYSPADALLRDRIILITGASDGIGRALAIEAARLGAQVLLHGRNVKKLEAVYDEIAAIEGSARPSIAVMDLTSADANAYKSLATSLQEEFGRLDGLVHNASILGERYSIEQYDALLWQQVMHVNVTAPFALSQVCLPLLRESADASVIFTSSGVGRTGRAFWGAYAVSKFRDRRTLANTCGRAAPNQRSRQLHQPGRHAHQDASCGIPGRRSGPVENAGRHSAHVSLPAGT